MTRYVSLLLFAGLLITGCGGGGDDALKDAGSQANSFPGNKNPGDGFSEQSTGDSSNNNGLDQNEVRITVEVPTSLAPNGEESRRNLRLAKPDNIDVYRTNQTLANLGSVETERRIDGDSIDVLRFPDGIPLAPDVMIEVSVNGQRLRGLAADDDRDIKINPFSEYLVRQGLGSYSQAQFQDVLDCTDADQSEGDFCLNRYVWSALSDQVQDFEIRIPDNDSIDDAVARLGQRSDFAQYVDDLAYVATIAPSDSDTISASSINMNTVFFGLELGTTRLFSSGSNQAGQWGLRRSGEASENGAITYPYLTLTKFDAFGINVTSMASDIPYERTSLALFPGGSLDYRSPEFWGINSHSVSPGGATIENSNSIRSGQSLFQTITGEGSSRTLGWTRNPYPLEGYLLGGQSDTRGLLTSYISGGKALELSGAAGDYQREDVQEESFQGIFEISLAQSDDFQISSLGNDYRVVSFSAQLSEQTSQRFRAESFVGKWASGNEGQYSQTATAEQISRLQDGTVAPAGTENRDRPVQISNRTSLVNGTNGNLVEKNTGRLNLDRSVPLQDDTAQPALGIGAFTPDTDLMAFSLNNSTDGTGILTALAPASGALEAGQFRVQGVIAGLSNDQNRLRQIDSAQIEVSSGGATKLTLRGHQVLQDLGTGELDAPSDLAERTIDLTCAPPCDTSDQLEFTHPTVSLTGYVTDDQEIMVLRFRETTTNGEEHLGLLFAFSTAP